MTAGNAANLIFGNKPVGYNYQSKMNFQQPKILLMYVRPQELVAVKTFPKSSLQYAAE